MVEIMERRQEVEWSPDMELDGLDAEKAAALLLAVAPGRRPQSFDGAAGQELNSARASSANHTDTFHSNSSDRSYGGADMASSPAYSPRSRSECSPAHHHTDGRVEGSPPRLSLSPRDESVDGVAVGAGIIGNDGPTGNRPRSSMRAMEDVINLLSGSAEGGGRGQLAVTSSSSANCSPRVNMDLERPFKSNHTGHPGGHVSSRSLVTTAEAVAATCAGMPSPRRAESARDLLSGPSSMLLSLAEFATKELLTMDIQHPRSGPLASSRTPPAAGSPNSQRSPRANPAAATTMPAAARSHGHHLRDRSARPRNRSGSFHDDDDDDDGDDKRRAAYTSGERVEDGGGGQRRRNRPRSTSMPEGMELHATRAWGGGYSTGVRHGNRIEAIKEEFDGLDGAPGTRSRTWRSSAGGGFAGSTARNRTAAAGDALFGSIEDAKALIGLGRHRGRWNSVADEEEGGRGSGSGDSGVAAEEGSLRGVDGEDRVCASLPHMLAKYADMYNKNGRIGIYTRQEREAIIARFKRKRGRRVWKKNIRYNCRKNLADKRLRIKGRFVKMSPEQRNALKLKQKAMRAAGARGGAAAAGGDVVNRTDSSTSAGSTEMELVASAGGDEVSSSAGSGATGEAFEDDCVGDAHVGDEGNEEDDEDEEEEEEEGGGGAEGGDEYPNEPPKRVRRHSIAY